MWKKVESETLEGRSSIDPLHEIEKAREDENSVTAKITFKLLQEVDISLCNACL